MVLVMEKTKKVPVCGGGGKINKQQWMIASLHQGFFILASSVSGQHVRHPSLFYPSHNCVLWQRWFIQLGLCGPLWESLLNNSHEGRQSTYGRVDGRLPLRFPGGKDTAFWDSWLLSTPKNPKDFERGHLSTTTFQCCRSLFWNKIWDSLWS